MERERVNHRSTRFMLECQHNHKPKPHLLRHAHVLTVPALPTLLVSVRRGPKGCYSHTHLFIMPVLAWAPKGKKADAMSSFANAGGGVGGCIAMKQASGILCGQESLLRR